MSKEQEEVICSTCGNAHNEWVMFETNTGRRKQYQCPKCYLKGQFDTGMHSQGRSAVFGKMKGKK